MSKEGGEIPVAPHSLCLPATKHQMCYSHRRAWHCAVTKAQLSDQKAREREPQGTVEHQRSCREEVIEKVLLQSCF
jgi:hypothetical protein